MEGIALYFRVHNESYLQALCEHLEISFFSIFFAMLLAIPLGIWGTKYKWAHKIIFGFFGALRVIPSLAILIVCIPILGTGRMSAIVALSILAIPPILMNTVLGIEGIDSSMLGVANGMGMSKSQIFFKVKIPLALPAVLTGMRIATVEVIASATLAAYIGAGGLGTLVFAGLSLLHAGQSLLLVGGISVAMLSLSASAFLYRLTLWSTRYKFEGGKA